MGTLAEIDPRITIMLIIGAIPAISGCYGAIFLIYRYVGKNFIKKDLCESQRDCIETAINGFKEEWLRDREDRNKRLDKIESLVSNERTRSPRTQ